MKRSNIFLGVITAILSVVGVAAAKRFTGTVRYYVTTGNKYCVATSPEFCVKEPSALHTCQTRSSGSTFILWTQGPAGVIGTSSKCTVALIYNSTDN